MGVIQTHSFCTGKFSIPINEVIHSMKKNILNPPDTQVFSATNGDSGPMENAMKNSSAGAVQNSGQPPADPAADQPEVKEDLLPLSKRRGFALIALLGGWFFTNEYLEYFGGVYPLLFASAFLLLTLWFISGRRKLHLQRPLFLLASAALLIGSGRFMVYGADEIKELWFLLLPLLGVFAVLNATEEYDGFSLRPITDTLAAVFLQPFASLRKIPGFLRAASGEAKLPRGNSEISRGLLIALPLTVVLAALLFSGDLNFQTAVRQILQNFNLNNLPDLSELVFRSIRTLIGGIYYFGLALAILLHRPAAPSGEGKTAQPALPITTTNTILLVINLLFLIYTVVQIKTIGDAGSLNTASAVSYHARSGFFSLLQVMGINFLLLVVLRKNTGAGSANAVLASKLLYALTWVFTGGLIVTSWLRMDVYESEYGWTYLRILVRFSLVFFVLLLIGVFVYFLKAAFPLVKAGISALLCLFILLSVLNLDALIAAKAGEIYQTHQRLDTAYLSNLSADAWETLSKTFHFGSAMDESERDLYTKTRDHLDQLRTSSQSRRPLTYSRSEADYLRQTSP